MKQRLLLCIRLRGDLIKVFKWYSGYNKGDASKVLRINNQARTRNNAFKLEKFRLRREIEGNWFSNGDFDEWNGLSSQIVSAETMESFERRLDKFMDGDGKWNQAAVLTQGLPRVGVTVFYSFLYFLVLLFSYVHARTKTDMQCFERQRPKPKCNFSRRSSSGRFQNPYKQHHFELTLRLASLVEVVVVVVV